MPLHDAALRGDVKSIRPAIKRDGVDVNAEDPRGYTALHLAVISGDIAFTLSLLQERHIDMNVMDNDQKTPLHHAVKSQSVGLVRLLLIKGARGDMLDSDGLLAKDYAEEGSSVRWLIDNFSAVGRHSNLAHFAQQDDTKAVVELLQAGAKVTAKDRRGLTALMHASSNGNAEMIRVLCENSKATLNQQDCMGRTALMWAAIKGQYNAALELLNQGCDIEVKDLKGETALYHVLLNAHGGPSGDPRWDIASSLVQAGADIEMENKKGSKPLSLFASMGKYMAVDWLAKEGAEVNTRSGQHGYTPLMECVNCDGGEEAACLSIKSLLDHGADTELLSNDDIRKTVLSLATEAGCVGCAKVLVAGGANVNTVVLAHGMTPLSQAAKLGNPELIRLFLSNGAYVNVRGQEDRTPLLHATMNEGTAYLTCVELLLEHGAKVDVQNSYRFTPLHATALKRHEDTMACLLKHKIKNVDIKNNLGNTPLQVAVRSQSFPCAQLLLRHGADVSTSNKKGWTLLDEASFRDDTKIVKALLEAGANPNTHSATHKGVSGISPLMSAASEGCLEACKMLIQAGADAHMVNSRNETAYVMAKRHHRVQDYLGQFM